MFSWIKKHWKKSVLFLLSLWPTLRLFLRWPIAAVSIATIPVQNFIQRRINIGPVTSKVIGFATFVSLMIVSWYIAEIIVALAAIALVMEALLLFNCIKNRIEEKHIEESLEVA